MRDVVNSSSKCNTFIDGLEITFEGSLTGSQLDTIRTNGEAFRVASESTGTGTQGEGSSTSEMKKVRIHKCIVKNGRVNVSPSILQGGGDVCGIAGN